MVYEPRQRCNGIWFPFVWRVSFSPSSSQLLTWKLVVERDWVSEEYRLMKYIRLKKTRITLDKSFFLLPSSSLITYFEYCCILFLQTCQTTFWWEITTDYQTRIERRKVGREKFFARARGYWEAGYLVTKYWNMVEYRWHGLPRVFIELMVGVLF